MTAIVLATAVVAAGCTSFNPNKFEDQVQKWVPLGTSEKDAQTVMEKHGFDCTMVATNSPFNNTGQQFLDCTKTEVMMHSWTADLFITDKKVSGYTNLTVE
jgi:hypothetical protein